MKPSLNSTVPPVVALIRCLNVVDSVYPQEISTWKEACKFYKQNPSKMLSDLSQLPSIISSDKGLSTFKEIKQYCFGNKTP